MSEEKNIKGFNYGYELAKLDPKLAKSITQSAQLNQSEAISYFKEGVKQYQREIFIARRNEQKQEKSKDKDLDRGR